MKKSNVDLLPYLIVHGCTEYSLSITKDSEGNYCITYDNFTVINGALSHSISNVVGYVRDKNLEICAKKVLIELDLKYQIND